MSSLLRSTTQNRIPSVFFPTYDSVHLMHTEVTQWVASAMGLVGIAGLEPTSTAWRAVITDHLDDTPQEMCLWGLRQWHKLAADIFRAILDSEVDRRFPLPQFWFKWSITTRVVINYLVQPTMPCVRPLRVTDLIISVSTNGGIRWATSFRFEDNHTASASSLTRGLQRDMPLHAYLSQSP